MPGRQPVPHGLTPRSRRGRVRFRRRSVRSSWSPTWARSTHVAGAHILHNFDWDWEGRRTRVPHAPSSSARISRWSITGAPTARAARRLLTRSRAELELGPGAGPSVGDDRPCRRSRGVLREALRRRRWNTRSARDEIDSIQCVDSSPQRCRARPAGHRREAIRELSRSFQLQGHPEVGAALLKAFDASGVDGASSC